MRKRSLASPSPLFVLLLLLVLSSIPGRAAIFAQSRFDVDNDGWHTVSLPDSGPYNQVADYGLSNFTPDVGNPPGCLVSVDVDGATTFFSAPVKFLGDQHLAVGGSLSYDLIDTPGAGPNWMNIPAVVLVSGDNVYIATSQTFPGDDWVHFFVPLVPGAWQKDNAAGAAPTPEEFAAALQNITALYVRMEYVNGGETGYLDNVVLGFPNYQPDLSVKGPNNPDFIGQHVYNDQAVQTAIANTGATAVYDLRLGDDGDALDTVVLHGAPGAGGWTVKYLDMRPNAPNGGDITAFVTSPAGAKFTVNTLAALPLRVVVTADVTVPNNAKFDVEVGVQSFDDPTKADYVVLSTTKLPMQSVALLGAPLPPVLVTTSVTFTAVPLGGGPAEFKFRTGTIVDGVTTWNPLPATYTPNPVFCWTPPALGTYCVMVYAREQGKTVVKWSPTLTYTVVPPLSALALTVAPASPQPWDQTLTLTVTPTGGAKLEYRFKACYRDANNVLQWVMLRDYAPAPVWIGKLPPDVARTYTLYAYAREQGTTVNYLLYAPAQNFTTKPPLSALTMTVTPASPQPWDKTLTVTAKATDGVKLEYQFKATYLDATGALVKLLLQDYSLSAIWSGKLPQDVGRTYTLYVYAREQGTTVLYLKSVTQPFTTKPPLSDLKMSVTPASPQPWDRPLTVKALPIGGCAPEYAFKATYTDAVGALVKLTLQDYSPALTWTGKLPQDAARTYTLYVYAREQGTTVTYLKSVTQNFTTKPPVTALVLQVAPPSPQVWTQPLTLTAKPTGGAQLEFRFTASYLDANNNPQVIMLRDYAAEPTWTGKLPQGVARNYQLHAEAREQGTIVDVLISAPPVAFATKAPLSQLGMLVTPPSPQPKSVKLTIKALPTDGASLEFAFKATYTDATGALVKLTLQDYSPADTWMGLLPQDLPRTYILYVYAREQGTTVAYLKSANQNFTTKPDPLIVSVLPADVTLRCGESQAYKASVENTANQNVTWSVRNSAKAPVAGVITADGLFTAPFVPDTYTIIATSAVDGKAAGSTTVTVVDQLPVAANMVFRFAANLGLTADANGNVSAWTDTSGAGHSAAQTDVTLQPTLISNAWHGQPVVHFDGAVRYLPVTGEFATAQYFIVWRANAAPFPNYGAPIGNYAPGTTGEYRPYLLEFSATTFHSNPYPNTVWKNGMLVTPAPFDLGTVTDPMETTICGARPDLSRSYLLGGTIDSGGYFIPMDVAEIVGFSANLADADRQAVEAYLKAKYGL